MATYPRCVVQLALVLEDWGGATVTKTITAIPREVEITRNDARTADKARVVLDWRDYPIDPRAVRDCLVTVLLGDVGSPSGSLTGADTAFIGVLDAPESTREESGAWVTLECRDLTARWLDTRWTFGMVDISRPLTDVLDALAAHVPGMSGVSFGFSVGAASTVVSQTTGRTKWAPTRSDDAWTVLTGICGAVGLVPVFVADLLLILSPDDFGVDRATFLGTGALTPAAAAFTYGELDGAESLVIRRKYGSAQRRQVQVLCWDETARKATSAKYPTAPIVTSKTAGADGTVTETAAPVLTFHVSGPYTPAALAAVAQRIYEEVAREEVEVVVKTHRIVPALGNGARVVVSVSPSLSTDLSGMSQGEAVAALTTGPRALAPDVAEAFVTGWRTAQSLAREFYAREVVHRWSREDGYSAELTLINILGATAAVPVLDLGTVTITGTP